MKEEKFLLLMNDIDDAYIREASEYRAEAEHKKAPERKFSFRKPWLRYGALAAACLLVAVAAYGLLPGEGKGNDGKNSVLKPGTESDLPTLSVEHYAAKVKEPDEKFGNPSQESDGNPWAPDAEVETLPVYENIAYAGKADRQAAPVSNETLKETIQLTAAAMDMTVKDVEYHDGEGNSQDETDQDDISYKAKAHTDTGTITVTYNSFIKVEYDQPQSLPQEYTVAAEDMTNEKAEEITEHLLDEYGKLMGFSNPKASIRMFYDSDGQAKWIFSGYDDNGDSLQEQIVSYNLKRMRFELDENGQLTGIAMLDNLASGRKIEEYPIITAEEAKELLSRGEYVTNHSISPKIENIEKEALIYLTGPECNIFMPYYAFDVRIDEKDGGLICYSTYYVPAVKEEYLDRMPASDGRQSSVQQDD